ncbi:hypothetical protein [Paracoccus sp. PAR01]|uniref:hypothetical protein n=1 Tax=Paracoccus sp. PAR01 TaxID=2769282 RepID=UPI00177F42DF|nr:hypothetical protein [Paracoccus sp. PAR01]MBD9528659.1 hypothetical protein [Paracoccus sp. PAR01]
MKKLNAVVIGGSNTVMRPGYMTELSRCFQRYGIDLNIAANLAVGHTSTLMGLIQLKANPEIIRAADVLFVEYTLNDSSFFKGTDGLEKWSRAFEGVVRFARSINHHLKIVPIIFASRVGVHRTGVNPLHGGVHYFSSYYDLAVADVNATFVKRFGSEFPELLGTYQDTAHYQRPIITTIAAEIVAECAYEYLLSDRSPPMLPPKVCAADYSNGSLLNHAELPDIQVVNFKNKVYDEDAFQLAGSRIALEIEDGTLLGAKYICVADAAQLYIQGNGDWYQCQTLQPGLVKPAFKFLMAMLTFDIKQVEGINRFMLTTIAPDGSEPSKMLQSGTRQPVREERSLPIACLLYTGRLVSASVTTSQELAAS